MRWVKYVLKRVSRASTVIVPVLLLLPLVSFIPGVAAEVALLEGKDQAVGPGEGVEYRFYVRNNNRISEKVTISVSTDFDHTISSNDFQLGYGEDRDVTVTVTAPEDAEIEIEETVIIMFLEISNVDTDTSGFSFYLLVVPPEEIPDEDGDGIPDYEDEDYDDGYYDDDYDSFPFESEEQIEEIKMLFVQLYLLAVVVTIIAMVSAVVIIKRKFIEAFDESLWDVEIRSHINTIFQGGYAHPSMKTIWTLRNIGGSIGGVFAFWAGFLVFDIFFWSGFPIVSLICGTALVFLLIWAPIQANFYYENYRFILKKDRVVVHSGIVTRWKTVVPYVRITDVDTIAGFWDRIYGVKTIRINTAGSSSPEAYIKGVFNPEPIMDHILKKARIARDGAGLQ